MLVYHIYPSKSVISCLIFPCGFTAGEPARSSRGPCHRPKCSPDHSGRCSPASDNLGDQRWTTMMGWFVASIDDDFGIFLALPHYNGWRGDVFVGKNQVASPMYAVDLENLSSQHGFWIRCVMKNWQRNVQTDTTNSTLHVCCLNRLTSPKGWISPLIPKFRPEKTNLRPPGKRVLLQTPENRFPDWAQTTGKLVRPQHIFELFRGWHLQHTHRRRATF